MAGGALAQNAASLTKELTINNEFPRDFLRSRSIVVIDAPSGTSNRINWQAIAEQVHPILRNASIDAVAYYELQTLLSGPDATQAFFNDIANRAIENVIILEVNASAKLTLTTLGKESLTQKGNTGWQTEAASAEEAAQALAQATSNAGLFNQNYLIGETPEYFTTTEIGFKRRFYSYPLDLKLDKLAIPAYTSTTAGTDSLGGLESIMQAYPYEWGITDPATTEQDLRFKGGYQFVLLYLRASPANIRSLLQYPPNESSQPQLQYTGTNQDPVYKFYIRQIANNEVYMGSNWDAAANWQQALQNFWQGLRKDQRQ